MSDLFKSGDLLVPWAKDPRFPYPVIYLGYYSSEDEGYPWNKPIYLIWEPDRGIVKQYKMAMNCWKIIARL